MSAPRVSPQRAAEMVNALPVVALHPSAGQLDSGAGEALEALQAMRAAWCVAWPTACPPIAR